MQLTNAKIIDAYQVLHQQFSIIKIRLMLNKNNFINLSEKKYYVKIKFIIFHISLVTKTLIHDGNVRTVFIENNDTR